MVSANLSMEGQLQLGNLLPSCPLSPVCQPLGIFLTGDHGLDHPPPRQTQRLGCDRAPLDVGLLEQLLYPIADAILSLREFGPVPSQIPEVLNLAWRNEAAAPQSVLPPVGDPLAVPNIGLSSRNRFHVLRIDQNQFELPVQNGPHRPPVDSRCFHGHVYHIEPPQIAGLPIAFPQEIRDTSFGKPI